MLRSVQGGTTCNWSGDCKGTCWSEKLLKRLLQASTTPKLSDVEQRDSLVSRHREAMLYSCKCCEQILMVYFSKLPRSLQHACFEKALTGRAARFAQSAATVSVQAGAAGKGRQI